MTAKTLALLMVLGLLTTANAQFCTTTVAAPNTETFDSGTTGAFTSCTATGSPGVLPAGWTLDASSTTPWVVNSGTTSSTNTGPPGDHTSGAGNYLYIETSGTCSGLQAELRSPCYDVTAINPNLDFWYHMWGPDCGTVRVDSWNGTNWVTVWEISGDQGNQWNQATVGIYTFMEGGGPRAAIRILGSDDSGTGFDGDASIDDVTVQDGPLSPPLAEWQLNQDQFDLRIDNLSASSISPVLITKALYQCTPVVPENAVVDVSSTLPGAPYDIVISNAPIVGGASAGLTLPDGQFINLDVSSTLTFLSTGSGFPGTAFLPGGGFPGATATSFSIPLSLTSPILFSTQGYVLDATATLGVRFSQATQLDVVSTPVPTSIPGPTLTTTNVAIDVTSSPTCWCPGGVPFYGSTYNTIYISPNGFVAWGGGGDTDTTPSLLDAMTDDGRVGFWTDLDPSEGGTVTVSSPATDLLRVDFVGVFYNTGGPAVTFGIEIDCASGVVQIDGLGGIVANPGTATTDDQWLGISPGLTLPTTDPGAAGFGLGLAGAAGAATDMLYEFNDTSVSLSGLPASIAGGMNTLIFSPDGSGNYTWGGF